MLAILFNMKNCSVVTPRSEFLHTMQNIMKNGCGFFPKLAQVANIDQRMNTTKVLILFLGPTCI